MPRAELIALSPDDLAVLTNRGVVKRAQRELESGEVTGDLSEADDGELFARWSDGIECRLPAGKVIAEGRCTCAATEVCRHIVRTVLAYQRRAATVSLEDSSDADAPAPLGGPWDPGSIGDDVLANAFRPAALTRARNLFEQGMLVELVRSAKPSAHFHVPPQTVRFLVPGDIRYTHCDCTEAAPCRHALLAVWAFRKLDATAEAGLVSTLQAAQPVPSALLDDLEQVVLEWFEQGLSTAPRSLIDRLARLEARCRSEGLTWPAEVIDELTRRFEQYLGHDALFDINRVVDLIGELVVRSDAIRNDTGAVPQLLIRGSVADRPSEIGATRFLGLGCGAQVGRKSVTLTSYLQDVNTGTVVVLERDFADPVVGSTESPREFWKLAQTPAVKGATLAALGVGQLTLQGGKRSPANRLVVGRTRAVVNPQAFAWEQVRAPILAEDFDELRARLTLLPPASLRPRRVAEDFHVVPIAAVEASGFDTAAQVVRATIRDPRGGLATLEHPSYSRGREGVDALLDRLSRQPDSLRFVAGHSRLGPQGLVIAPVALVFQANAIAPRQAVQPWVDRADGASGPAPAPALASLLSRPTSVDPIDDYLRQLLDALGELAILGLSRADSHVADRWRELARFGESIGFHRLTRPVSALADTLEQKRHRPRWDSGPGSRLALDLAMLVRLAIDLSM